MQESFLHQGKRVLIIHFRQFGAEKTSKFFLKVVQNHLKREKKLKKKFIFPYIPRIQIRMTNFVRIRNTEIFANNARYVAGIMIVKTCFMRKQRLKNRGERR